MKKSKTELVDRFRMQEKEKTALHKNSVPPLFPTTSTFSDWTNASLLLSKVTPLI